MDMIVPIIQHTAQTGHKYTETHDLHIKKSNVRQKKTTFAIAFTDD